MMLKRAKKLSVIVALLSFTLLISVSLSIVYVCSIMSEEHTYRVSDAFLTNMNYDMEDTTDVLPLETEIKSKQGHTIPITYFLVNDNFNRKTIVLVHWYGTDHLAMYPLKEIFLKYGYNVVLYDQRAHGSNTAKTVTFGLYEKDDLADVIDYIENQASDDIEIGLLGQSMGASTVGYYLGTQHSKQHVDFAIMESPFSSMSQEIEWKIEGFTNNRFISSLLVNVSSNVNQLVYGYKFEDVNILGSMQNNTTPTMIMHSKRDRICPFSMSKELFSTIPHTSKRFIVFDDTQHLQTLFQNRAKYIRGLKNFLGSYSKL